MLAADGQYPARPYPGARPPFSFVHLDGSSHPVTPDAVDGWLADHDAAPLAGRFPVLAYGSNACPSKITWLRDAHGLAGPVVVLRAGYEGIAAVWAAGFRVIDEQRPATLAALPGVVEQHAVWLATPDQIAALDKCEGRGERYELAHVRTGSVTLEDGARVDGPLAYLGLAGIRMPLLVDGAIVRCADVAQSEARGLVGVPAGTDGLLREALEPGRP